MTSIIRHHTTAFIKPAIALLILLTSLTQSPPAFANNESERPLRSFWEELRTTTHLTFAHMVTVAVPISALASMAFGGRDFYAFISQHGVQSILANFNMFHAIHLSPLLLGFLSTLPYAPHGVRTLKRKAFSAAHGVRTFIQRVVKPARLLWIHRR